MKKDKELAIAISLAAHHHVDQTDKGGNVYILHPLEVMNTLASRGDYHLMAAGVLHDILEDCPVTEQDLLDAGISIKTVRTVKKVTKVKGQKPRDYLLGILYDINASKVKLADLKHNLDLLRVREIDEKAVKRIKKYVDMYTVIEQSIAWQQKNFEDSDSYYNARDEYLEELSKILK